MKQNYKKTININYYCFLPSLNHSKFMEIQFVLVDFLSQFMTSHAIFNCYAYAEWVDWIISYKSSSFLIHDVASRNMLPMPKALRPNTYNNCSETNLTKVGFGNGGHCSAIIINLCHSRLALARVWLVTF